MYVGEPIVSNKAIELIDKMDCKDQSLTFTALFILDIAKPSQSELEIHIPQVRLHIHSTYILYIHTYIHTYKNTYVHTYIHTYIQKYIQKYIHTYILTYIIHL